MLPRLPSQLRARRGYCAGVKCLSRCADVRLPCSALPLPSMLCYIYVIYMAEGVTCPQLRCLHGFHRRLLPRAACANKQLIFCSCLAHFGRSFECVACTDQTQHDHAQQQQKPDEHERSAIFVRAADGRCLSVFPQAQGSFTVLQVVRAWLRVMDASMTFRQLKQEISKEDGICGSLRLSFCSTCAALFVTRAAPFQRAILASSVPASHCKMTRR